MKLHTKYGVMLSAVLLSASTLIYAEDHDGTGKGVQSAINQNAQNIENFKAENPDKDVPKGMLHSGAVLASVLAGERPQLPDAARATRPELPDVASARPSRPELPDVASARPSRPDRPVTGRP